MLELLYEQNYSKSVPHERTPEDFLATLKNQTQETWFWTEVFVSWRGQYDAPISRILTKWGICFNFNLLPASELLNMEV
jgi:hypothetical protein